MGYQILANPFLEDLEAELHRAEAAHGPQHSIHESYAVILEEVDELWDECRKRAGERNMRDVRKELIQIAAMAWRAARDLGVEK
jgi:hypothetical protein